MTVEEEIDLGIEALEQMQVELERKAHNLQVLEQQLAELEGAL